MIQLEFESLQDMFDRVATHLMKQQRRSEGVSDRTGEPMCRYRSSDGTACAIGALIPDDQYTEDLEYNTVGELLQTDELTVSLNQPIDTDDTDLAIFRALVGLQQIHDHRDPYTWESGLYEFALKYNLSARAIRSPFHTNSWGEG